MRLKIKIKNFEGDLVQKEKEISSKDHLEAQIKYKHMVFRDKTKYTRKKKHKNHQSDEY
jgi:hypothetical protein